MSYIASIHARSHEMVYFLATVFADMHMRDDIEVLHLVV